jgi:hypothetical protein
MQRLTGAGLGDCPSAKGVRRVAEELTAGSGAGTGAANEELARNMERPLG